MSATSQDKTKFYDYEGFVEKFKPKKTTDDCYTPPLVYDAVADWVANEYGVDKNNFCRLFYPGGDYENFDYAGKIVVDNPPFSILMKVVKFYTENNIKFFLFSPTNTASQYGNYCSLLLVGVDVTYENGAIVPTSFITNLEPFEVRARTVPTLYNAVYEANKKNNGLTKKTVRKYAYPPELVTCAAVYNFSKYGINFVIPRAESVRVRALDEQRRSKSAIFGGGWLVSAEVKAEREKAEREKAEREKAERFELSEREKAIVNGLGCGKTQKQEE